MKTDGILGLIIVLAAAGLMVTTCTAANRIVWSIEDAARICAPK
jgi:hypothetical protein